MRGEGGGGQVYLIACSMPLTLLRGHGFNSASPPLNKRQQLWPERHCKALMGIRGMQWPPCINPRFRPNYTSPDLRLPYFPNHLITSTLLHSCVPMYTPRGRNPNQIWPFNFNFRERNGHVAGCLIQRVEKNSLFSKQV